MKTEKDQRPTNFALFDFPDRAQETDILPQVLMSTVVVTYCPVISFSRLYKDGQEALIFSYTNSFLISQNGD